MTVIAFDGRSMAGDKRTSFGGLHGTTQKVHRINGCLIGCAGNAALIKEMVEWFRRGAVAQELPEKQRGADDCVSMLVVSPDGQVLQYENTPYPLTIENKQWAIGSGRDFAVAAMHLGCNAYQAVEVACLFDVGCGNGIDVLNLSEKQE